MNNLVLTTVLDSYGNRQWRYCAKLWAASLLRHCWGGEIRIYSNLSEPLFPVERRDLYEIEMTPLEGRTSSGEVDWRSICRDRRLAAARNLTRSDAFDWILFSDADCIVTRNPDHLFVEGFDILVSRRLSRPDPGFFAVRGAILKEVLSLLELHGGLTENSLESLLRNTRWRAREFERGEVVRPTEANVSLLDLANAAVIHFSGLGLCDKTRLAFALHMMAIYGDKEGMFFDMMES